MTSVNTNAAALTALRTLQNTNQQLETVQSRISTGLKIGEAKDNAAYWAISTTLKSDNKALSTVKDALGLGAATVDVAYQGLTKAKEVLDEIKVKLTAATQDGVDRSVIQSEISELQNQLKSIADSSVFSGENWLSIDSNAVGYNKDKSIVASFTRDGSNSVSIGTVGVDISKVALFDKSASATGIIDSAVSLKKSDGTALMVGGTDTATPLPVKQGLDASVAVAGTIAGGPTAAAVSLGTVNLSGLDKNDSISFNVSVDGGAAKAVSVKLTSVTDAGTFKTALDAALVDAGLPTTLVQASNTAGEIKLTSQTSGLSSSVVVTGLAGTNGNGKTAPVTTGTIFGLANTAATALGSGTAGVATTGAYAAGAGTAAGDKMTFVIEYNGDVYDATMTMGVDATPTAGEFKTLIDGAIANAVKRVGGTQLGANKISYDATARTFTTDTKGLGSKVSISEIKTFTGNAGATPTTADATANANITQGLSATTNVVGTSSTASYSLGNFATNADGAGDTFSMDISVQSAASGTNVMRRETIRFSTGDASEGAFATNLQLAIDAKFGANVLKVDTGGADIKLITVGAGPNESVTVNALNIVDGDTSTTSALGLGNASKTGVASTSLAGGTSTSGAAFAPQTFSDIDAVKFDVSLNGNTAKTVTINKAVIESALNAADGYTAGSGAISNSAQYLKVVQKALANASVTGITASIVASGADAGKLQFTTTATGSGQSVTVTNVQASGASTADTMSVDKISLTSSTFTSLSAADRKDVLGAYIAVVSDAITRVTSAASNLGSVASRIDLQKTFVNTLMDTIDKGVGNLIDADMTEESTKLQALQVKSQLGVQALSIANQSAQNVLSLFRG